jgi:glucose-6-phosphate dehydrogenase assembly protein OpcA
MEETMSSVTTTTIDPEKIRKELSDLWVELAKEKESAAGVLRARSMTLIAAMSEHDDPGEIGETLAMLMREHPSRAIVVRVRDSEEHYLASRVFAQCWMPFGDRRQICCEQVEITSSSASLGDLPAVILPLTVADLPVVLWSRSMAAIDKLGPIAGKIIVDGEIIGDLGKVSELARGYRIGDLAWTRLTRWRELIAQIFENKCYLAELPSIARVRITYKGAQPSISAFYMAAWLERKDVIWERGNHSGIALETASGEVHTSLKTTDETCVEVAVRKQVTNTMFQPETDYTLLREELSIPGRDAIFEAVLPRAARIAAEFRSGPGVKA